MVNRLAILLTLILAIACGKGGMNADEAQLMAATSRSQMAPGAVPLREIGLGQPVPTPALNFEVQLDFVGSFSGGQERKLLQAAELIKRVIASEEFKREVLNHRWQGKRQFANNNGLSNASIYKRIVEGQEVLNRGIDNTMNLNLDSYFQDTRVIGYTYPSVMTVWMNTKFMNQRTAAKVTETLMHEWLHKLGFGHAAKPTPERPFSVPYAVGYIMGRLAERVQ
jgi:hypothetical protein